MSDLFIEQRMRRRDHILYKKKSERCGSSFVMEHQLSDGATRLVLNEFQGRWLLHIRKYVNEKPTQTGIAIPQDLLLKLIETKRDFERAYNEKIGLVKLLNDYIQLEVYPSGKLDMRYYFVINGERRYSKKGISLSKKIADELFNVLENEF